MSNDSILSEYHVMKVEKTTAPVGMLGEDWYLYVIQKGNLVNSTIDCKKTGTLKSVTEHAEDMVEIINSRNVKVRRK